MADFFGIGAAVQRAIPESLRNPLAAWKKIADRLEYTFDQQFSTGGYGHWMLHKYPYANTLMSRSGKLRASRHVTFGENFAALRWGGDLEYGRLHQQGGVTHPHIDKSPMQHVVGHNAIQWTSRARAYFWYQWYATKEDRWKWMALSKKSVFEVSVPARPVSLTAEDLQFIYDTLGTREVSIITNYGASILPY